MEKVEKKASYNLGEGKRLEAILTGERLEEHHLTVWHYWLKLWNPKVREGPFIIHRTFGSEHEVEEFVNAMQKATFLFLDGHFLLLPQVTNPWNVGVGSDPQDFQEIYA